MLRDSLKNSCMQRLASRKIDPESINFCEQQTKDTMKIDCAVQQKYTILKKEVEKVSREDLETKLRSCEDKLALIEAKDPKVFSSLIRDFKSIEKKSSESVPAGTKKR